MVSDKSIKSRASIMEEALKAISDDPDVYIEKLQQPLEHNSELGTEFVNWAEEHSQLKVFIKEIPLGIFPDGVKVQLADVKVHSRGPDDLVYDKDAELRQKVARGNAFIRIQDEPWNCVTYALKKFTGGMGDDDDRSGGGDKLIWKRYFVKDISEASSVISLRKANGEAAHLSCIKYCGVHYLIAGSKNVHLIIRKKSDIDKYDESRYQYAREISDTILAFLETMERSKVIKFLDFLAETRLTMVFEILNPNHQHVEDLSYLGEKSALKFITWTSTNLGVKDELCIFPPDISIKLAAYFGFDPVEYKEISAVEAEAHMLQIRHQHGFEGEVFYYLDRERNVIGLLKKKTAWYIICRAVREKVRNALFSKNGLSVPETKRKLNSRLREIKSWLNLDEDSVKKWQELSVGYVDWVVSQKAQGKLCARDVADKFPVTWSRFLEDSQLSDNVEYANSVLC